MVKRLTVRDLKFSHVVAAKVKTIFEKVFGGVRKRAKTLGQFAGSVRATQRLLTNGAIAIGECANCNTRVLALQSLIRKHRALCPTGEAEEWGAAAVAGWISV